MSTVLDCNGKTPSGLFSICYHEVAGELWDLTHSFSSSEQSPARETCDTGIYHFDRLTHWRDCGGEYLRRLKWATCQRSTSYQATGRGRATPLVSRGRLIEGFMGGVGPPSVQTQVIHLLPGCLSFLCLHLPPPTSQETRHWEIRGPHNYFGSSMNITHLK